MFGTLGTIYLIHFDQLFSGRSHYLGWAPPIASLNPDSKDREEGFKSRIQKHRESKGSRLLSSLNHAKIGWEVVMVWTMKTVQDEQRMKNWKKSKQFCPVCSPDEVEHGGIAIQSAGDTYAKVNLNRGNHE